jgi:urease accessory protein
MITNIAERDVHGYTPERCWKAKLNLGFQAQSAKTVLKNMSFTGPLRVQRPFYPEGPPCHVYVLHPPGGMVSGDRLSVDIDLQQDSHAVLTTPSAGKVYGADAHNVAQHQQVSLRLGKNSICEWMPQETIVYDGAHGVLQTRVDLEEGARFLGWDICCLGLPAGGRPFVQGSIQQQLALYQEQVPRLLERQRIEGSGTVTTAAWGLADNKVTGTMLCTLDRYRHEGGSAQALIEQVRVAMDAFQVVSVQPAMISVTYRLGLLVIRYLGNSAEQCRHAFKGIRDILRPAVLDMPAVSPRIWAT